MPRCQYVYASDTHTCGRSARDVLCPTHIEALAAYAATDPSSPTLARNLDALAAAGLQPDEDGLSPVPCPAAGPSLSDLVEELLADYPEPPPLDDGNLAWLSAR